MTKYDIHKGRKWSIGLDFSNTDYSIFDNNTKVIIRSDV